MKSNLFTFSLIACGFGTYLRYHFLTHGHRNLHLCFPSKIFIVLALNFGSLMHLELIFIYGLR